MAENPISFWNTNMEKYNFEQNTDAQEIRMLARKERQKRISQGESISEPTRVDYERADEIVNAWTEAKKENFERAGKYYEIPARFPYLLHESTIDKIEAILHDGIKKSKAGYFHKTSEYVDEDVVCANIPYHTDVQEEPVFPGASYGDIAIFFKMKPGEKVYQEEVSDLFPFECRIDRDIKSQDISSIQISGRCKENEMQKSLWGKFFSKPAIFKDLPANIYPIDGQEEHFKAMTEKYFESGIFGIKEAAEFLKQYNLTSEEYENLLKIDERGKKVKNEFENFLQKFRNAYFDEERCNELQAAMMNDDFDKMQYFLDYSNAKFKAWEDSHAEMHAEAVAMQNEVKKIFLRIATEVLDINPNEPGSYFKYLTNLAKKYGIEVSDYEIIQPYVERL